MITQSKDYLSENGILLLVVEARIKPWVSRQMKEVFGNCKIVKRGPKNVVVMATK
jgi:16S rRNA G1207 methylase RsmC